MTNRKGLAKGQGKGYKNVIGKDPAVHSQSAKGIKQPQRIKVTLKNNYKTRNPNLPKAVFNKILKENELNLLKRRLNDGKITPEEIFERQEYFKLSSNLTEKGKKWLMNLWKTDKGKERKNNPFQAREEYVLENFDRIELIGFYNSVTSEQLMMGINDYRPLYRVYAEDGSHFDYHVGFESRNQKVPINLIG